jgi:very-short-patch-repair endonuclease
VLSFESNLHPLPSWEGEGGGGKREQMKKPLTPIAKKLRNDPTDAEKRLWNAIRVKSLGVKFRRQAAIGSYIVDFVCFEKRLIIEVDGGQHCRNQEDIKRDEWLRNQGFKVLRFWNPDVLKSLEGVEQRIVEHLKSPLPDPPHKGEGAKF